MKNKPIKLSDIAEKLNVSTVTVSKALRGHPDISQKTTKLIKETAEKIGYTPNFMARNLSSRKSNTIGVIVPKIAHFFFGAIIESIYDIAFRNNYEIILTVSQENEKREKKHIQTLLSMKVDGIIISISQETKDYSIFDAVKARGVPIVFMDRIPAIPDVDTVSVNDRLGAFMAIEHLIKLGHTRIGHFAGYSEINIGKERYLGFEDAMNKYNIPINPDWICHGGFGEKAGYDSFIKLYQKNSLPDVIFTVTYPVALGIYMAASELGLKIPDDIDVICFGNAKVMKFFAPPLSCVDQPTELIAEKSMKLLLNKINNPDDKSVNEVEIPTDLVLRGTCRTFNRK